MQISEISNVVYNRSGCNSSLESSPAARQPGPSHHQVTYLNPVGNQNTSCGSSTAFTVPIIWYHKMCEDHPLELYKVLHWCAYESLETSFPDLYRGITSPIHDDILKLDSIIICSIQTYPYLLCLTSFCYQLPQMSFWQSGRQTIKW